MPVILVGSVSAIWQWIQSSAVELTSLSVLVNHGSSPELSDECGPAPGAVSEINSAGASLPRVLSGSHGFRLLRQAQIENDQRRPGMGRRWSCLIHRSRPPNLESAAEAVGGLAVLGGSDAFGCAFLAGGDVGASDHAGTAVLGVATQRASTERGLGCRFRFPATAGSGTGAPKGTSNSPPSRSS